MMESGLVFTLLLIGVASGWILGYRYAQQKRHKETINYVPSMAFLLAEANDSALEQILSVRSVTEETLDLYLKLGRSLRDKGEVERAIHLHQSLFARTDLDKSTLQQVELELAIDYARAGLNDRAESLLLTLLDSKGVIYEQASLYLIELYEEEGEWQNILDLYQQKRLHGSRNQLRITHAVCQLAECAHRKNAYLETQKLCRLAQKIAPQNGRPWVILANLAFEQNEPREAIRCYLRAIELSANTTVHVLDNMVAAFQQIEDSRGLDSYLEKHWQQSRFVPALIAKTHALIEQQGIEPAIQYLLRELYQHPTNIGFLALVELVVKHRQQLEKSQLLVLYDILRRIVASEPRFVCTHCGFKAQEPEWRCPSCKSWSTMGPFVATSPKATLDI